MKEQKKKDVIIFVLCLLLITMSMGYAILSQKLTINGVAKVNGTFSVVITDINVTENKTKTAKNKTALITSPVSATFSAELLQPNDYIEYLVTIKNNGSIDAQLEFANLSKEETDYIKFERYGAAIDNPILNVGETTTIKIKVSFKDANNMPDENDRQAQTTLLLKYVQKTI